MNLERFEKLKNNIQLLDIDLEKGTVKHKFKNNKLSVSNTGYVMFNFLSVKYYVHQIIAVAAGMNIVGITVNHKDGNKQNNSIHNLEPATYSEQMLHAKETGLWKPENISKATLGKPKRKRAK